MTSQRDPGQGESSSPTNTTASGDSFERALAKGPSVPLAETHFVRSQHFDFNLNKTSPTVRTRSAPEIKAAHGMVGNEHFGANNHSPRQLNISPWHNNASNRATRTSAFRVLFKFPLWLLLVTVLCFATNLVAAAVLNAKHTHKKNNIEDPEISNPGSAPLKVWLGLSIGLLVISCVYFGYAFDIGLKRRRNVPHEAVANERRGQSQPGYITHATVEAGLLPYSTLNISNRALPANNSIEVRSEISVHTSSQISNGSVGPQHGSHEFLCPRDRLRETTASSYTSVSVYSDASSSNSSSAITTPEVGHQDRPALYPPRTSSIHPGYSLSPHNGLNLATNAAYPSSGQATAREQISSPLTDPLDSQPRPNRATTSGRSLSFCSQGTEVRARVPIRPSLMTMSSVDTVRPKTAGYFSDVGSFGNARGYPHARLSVATGMQQATAVQILTPGKARSLQISKMAKDGSSAHRLSRSVGDLDDLIDVTKGDGSAGKAMTMTGRTGYDVKGENVHVHVIPATPEQQQLSSPRARRPDSYPPMSPPISPLSPTGAVWGTPYPPGEATWDSPYHPVSPIASTETLTRTAPQPTRPLALRHRSYETRSSWLARMPASTSLRAAAAPRRTEASAPKTPRSEKDLPPLPLGSHPPTLMVAPGLPPVPLFSSHPVGLGLPVEERSSSNDARNLASASKNPRLPARARTPEPMTTTTTTTMASVAFTSPTKRSPPVRSVSDDQIATKKAALRGVRGSSSSLSMGLSQSARIDVGRWLVYAKELGL